MSKYKYSASPTNINKDMPLFLNKYVVTFILPTPLQAIYGADILTESVVKVDGLDLDKLPEVVEQSYRGVKRKFAGLTADTSVDIEMTFAVNVTKAGKIPVLNIMRDWSRLMWNHDGVVVTKEEYAGAILIEVTDVKDNLLRKVSLPVVFLSEAIPAMELNYDENNIYEMVAKFHAENISDSYI